MQPTHGRKNLEGRTVYVPRMPYGGARLMATAFRSIGVDAAPTPASNERTRELGLKYTSGDECYPEQITIGDFTLKKFHAGERRRYSSTSSFAVLPMWYGAEKRAR